MRILHILILSLISYFAFGQEPKATNMKEVFKKEFSDIPETDISLITPPEILPDWFFHPPSGDLNSLYAIGISDPWIDNIRGNKQAKFRALSLASFMYTVTTKGISDVYNAREQNFKFEQMTRFISSRNISFESFVLDSFITKYQEYIFLYKFKIGEGGRKNGSLIDYYKSVTKLDAGFSKLEKFTLIGKIDDITMTYRYQMMNNNFEIMSVMDSDSITIKPTVYQYTKINNSNNPDTIGEISLFKRGLWQGYFKSLIDNLDIAASEIESEQKSVSEINSNSNEKVNFNQLNRGVYNTIFSFNIVGIKLINNEMVIHLNTTKVKN